MPSHFFLCLHVKAGRTHWLSRSLHGKAGRVHLLTIYYVKVFSPKETLDKHQVSPVRLKSESQVWSLKVESVNIFRMCVRALFTAELKVEVDQ